MDIGESFIDQLDDAFFTDDVGVDVTVGAPDDVGVNVGVDVGVNSSPLPPDTDHFLLSTDDPFHPTPAPPTAHTDVLVKQELIHQPTTTPTTSTSTVGTTTPTPTAAGSAPKIEKDKFVQRKVRSKEQTQVNAFHLAPASPATHADDGVNQEPAQHSATNTQTTTTSTGLPTTPQSTGLMATPTPTPSMTTPTSVKDKLAQRKLRNKESARRYREKQVARRRHLEHYTRSLSEQNRELENLHDRLLTLTCTPIPAGVDIDINVISNGVPPAPVPSTNSYVNHSQHQEHYPYNEQNFIYQQHQQENYPFNQQNVVYEQRPQQEDYPYNEQNFIFQQQQQQLQQFSSPSMCTPEQNYVSSTAPMCEQNLFK